MVVCGSLFVVQVLSGRCYVFVVCSMLCVACCLLFDGCWFTFVICSMVCVVGCCLLLVAGWLLDIVCCLLYSFVVCRFVFLFCLVRCWSLWDIGCFDRC